MAARLEFMEESEGDLLAVRARGTLTRDDYDQVLAPRLASLVQRFGSVRVLFVMDEPFQGWDLGGAWANTTMTIRRRNDLVKVAMVGAPTWEEWCAELAGLLIAGEVRTFPADRLPDAWKWLRA